MLTRRQVAALECRILRLMADYEVAAVTAGREAEQQAVDKLQAVQDQLVAVEKVRPHCNTHVSGHTLKG